VTRNRFEGFADTLPREIADAGFRQQFVPVGDVTLSTVGAPRTGRPPLVLVPAQMGTWRTYAPVMVPLQRHFDVTVVEVRGHGASTWTTGDYSWDSVGGDLARLIQEHVGEPAVISGNSSGGILALWCAARMPESTTAIVLEDAPVFSAELPRFRDRDRFVYRGLEHIASELGDPAHRNLADYFRGLELPVNARRTKRMPEWFVRVMERSLARHAAKHPGEPAGLDTWWLPPALSDLYRSLDMFDPDFARAFVDGRFYGDFDHADALRAVRCPILLLHADWKRLPEHGLVGALDDDDARRVQELAPQTVYERIPANHVIHRYRPREFVRALTEFAGT
jgi:pimeloyl-ACP methyl ester carboxylesterase